MSSFNSCAVDLGSFTLLFRQPVAALQIRYHSTNEWKWVKPQDATLTVNACDALQFLTGDFVKSTVHRYALVFEFCIRYRFSLFCLDSVTVPPKDQQHVDRLGLLYFSRYEYQLLRSCSMNLCKISPHNDIPLATVKESPVLQREGYTQNTFERTGNPVPTMEGKVGSLCIIRTILTFLSQSGLLRNRSGRERKAVLRRPKSTALRQSCLDSKSSCTLKYTNEWSFIHPVFVAFYRVSFLDPDLRVRGHLKLMCRLPYQI